MKNLCYVLAFVAMLANTAQANMLNVSQTSGNLIEPAGYQVCFTPGGNCTGLLVNQISQAKKTIFVQAYSFTSAPIAKALKQAVDRGVSVMIILDKSQVTQKYSSADYFTNAGISVWVDYKPAIAHNKVMAIDEATLVTGSFNFTKAAEEKNAENLIIIHDEKLSHLYFNNWSSRQTYSLRVDAYKN
jgi:phosphatidylserine/phosphatidylglycerophosphate/cardiolipin synthase-like enzyme